MDLDLPVTCALLDRFEPIVLSSSRRKQRLFLLSVYHAATAHLLDDVVIQFLLAYTDDPSSTSLLSAARGHAVRDRNHWRKNGDVWFQEELVAAELLIDLCQPKLTSVWNFRQSFVRRFVLRLAFAAQLDDDTLARRIGEVYTDLFAYARAIPQPRLPDTSFVRETVISLAKGLTFPLDDTQWGVFRDSLIDASSPFEFIDHITNQTTHFPGCWLLDAVRGKS